MGILVQIAQFLLSLALIILVHELGHFLAARACRTRVDKFYLFFNPWFSLLRAKRIDGRWQFSWFSSKPPKEWSSSLDNTEWGFGWLPLGGYCKIAGMIDESMDTEAMKRPAQAWEYRSKPAWQRLVIITGGVLVNFITALMIYAMMLFAWGKEYLPLQNAIYGYDYCQTARSNGFVNGDRILFVNDKTPETLGEALEEILLADKKTVVVLRGSDTVTLALPSDFSQQMLAAGERQMAQERIPFVVESVTAGTPAAQAQLQSGDSIVNLNGHTVPFIAQISDTLLAYAEKPITLGFYRNGELLQQEITPSASGKIGVVLRSPLSFFETKRQEYGFFTSIPAGVKLGTQTLVSYVRSFKIMFTKEGAKSLGGFGTIGSLFTQVWSWAHFWSMTAFLCIIIAFMNILPIPALDGGHMVFILYEMVTRRKPSDKFLERVQMVGLYLLIALMVFANGNDLVRWLSKFW